MIAVRDEEREYQENLPDSERPNVHLTEPTVNTGKAIEQSDLSIEEGNKEEWAEAQRYLQNKGWVELTGEASNSEVYAHMKFTRDFAIEQARDFLKDA